MTQLDGLRDELRKFADERDWDQHEEHGSHGQYDEWR